MKIDTNFAMSISRVFRLSRVLMPLATLCACGLSDPEVPRAFYYDPPNELMGRDRSATWSNHQYVTRLTQDGFDTANLTRFTGEPLYYRNNAWNPDDQVIYAYKVNYKPSQTWLMSVSVPGLKREAVARIPDHPRGHSFSPLFAFDETRNQLVVADAQSPCGGQVTNIWYVYDVKSGEWAKNALDRYAFTTLNYDASEDNFVGVGFEFGEGRVVARIDSSGNVLSQVKADLCDALEPRQFGYEQIHYQSRIVDGVVHIYRHVYFGKHAEDGIFWERQRYLVDIASGDVRRQ
jgi:hypothetical protein